VNHRERRVFDPNETLTGSEVSTSRGPAYVTRETLGPSVANAGTRMLVGVALTAVYARSFRQGRGQERTETVTNPYANWVVRELTGGDWREGRATDDLVLSRFRAREMMFFRGRGRGGRK